MDDIALIDTPVLYSSLPTSFAHVLRRSLVAQDLLYLQKHPSAKLAHTKQQLSRGILLIASYLRSRGLTVQYYNDPLIDDSSLERAANTSRFVGLNSMTVSFPYIVELCSKLKSFNPNIITVVGGPHVSFADADALRCHDIDIVVRKYGEESLFELINEYPNLTAIKGISYRDDRGQIQRNPDRPQITTSLMPAYDLLGRPINHYKYNIPATLGCQGRCSFCLDWRLSPKIYARSIESVAQELGYLAQHLPSKEVVQFCDSMFTADPQLTYDLSRVLRVRDLGLLFFCDSTPKHITPDLVRALDDAGFIGIKMGFESSDPSILQLAKKPAAYQEYVNAAKLIHTHSSALVTAYWLSGLPGTTPSSLRETLSAVKHLLADGTIDILSHKLFVPYPGTAILERPEIFRGSIRTRDWHQYDRLVPDPVFVPNGLEKFDWGSYMCEVESTALRAYCNRLGISETDLDYIGEANSYKFGYCQSTLAAVESQLIEV